MIVDVFMKSDMFSTSCLSLSAIQKKKSQSLQNYGEEGSSWLITEPGEPYGSTSGNEHWQALGQQP